MSALTQTIEQHLAKKFEGTPCFLVEVVVKKARRQHIQIFIDCVPNITIQQCADVSRYLEQELEEAALVQSNYVLEVSSPGMDRPFKVFQQYTKNIGRVLQIELLDGTKQEGILLNVDETSITIEQMPIVDARKKPKHRPKKQVKKADNPKLQILLSNIKQTKKKVTFF